MYSKEIHNIKEVQSIQGLSSANSFYEVGIEIEYEGEIEQRHTRSRLKAQEMLIEHLDSDRNLHNDVGPYHLYIKECVMESL